MQGSIKITREQAVFFVFIGIFGNIVYSHTWIDDATDRSAWLACFLGILLLIPFAIWIFKLGKHYADGTIFDILETGLGKFTSAAVSVIYILINIAVAVAMLNMFTQMLKVLFLQYTPSWVIILSLVLMGAIFAKSGIKALGRLFEFLALLGTVDYFTSFIFAFPHQFHIQYVIPVFDTSWFGFVKGVIFIAGGASECLLILMIIVRFIPHPGKHYTWIAIALVLCALVFSFAIFVIIGVMSPELSKRIAFGGVNAARLIRIGEFIQGLEVFVLGSYQIIAIGKTTLSIYCIWSSAKKIFNNKKPVLLLFLTTLMVFVPSIWINSYSKAYFLAVLLGSYIILPFSVFVLLLASISIKVKNNRAGSASK